MLSLITQQFCWKQGERAFSPLSLTMKLVSTPSCLVMMMMTI